MNGIYAAYVTGKANQGFAMFVFRNGSIAGIDVAGVKYDGSYDVRDSCVAVNLLVSIPPNTSLVQGVTTGPSMEENELAFQLPHNYASLPFVRIDGAHGPVNVKLVKLRDIDD